MMYSRLAYAMLLGASLFAGPAAAKDVWVGYTYVGGVDQAAYRGLEKMAKAITEQSKGEIDVSIKPPGSLPINTQAITQAVGDNIIQFAADGFAIGNVPLTGIVRMPLLIHSPAEAKQTTKILAPYLQEAYRKLGVTILGEYIYPAQTIWSANKLASLADIKGQKLRVTSPEQAEFVRRMGGTAVTIGAPEVPSALQSGVVQGLLTASTGGGVLWKDQLKYNYRFPVNYFHSILIVNKSAFEKLSPANQAMVREVVARYADEITAEQNSQDIAYTKRFADGGMIVTELHEQEIGEATKRFADYWDIWTKRQSATVQEAMQKVRAALKR